MPVHHSLYMFTVKLFLCHVIFFYFFLNNSKMKKKKIYTFSDFILHTFKKKLSLSLIILLKSIPSCFGPAI